MKGCLRILLSSSASMRPIASLVPPGGNGTMIFTGLVG